MRPKWRLIGDWPWFVHGRRVLQSLKMLQEINSKKFWCFKWFPLPRGSQRAHLLFWATQDAAAAGTFPSLDGEGKYFRCYPRHQKQSAGQTGDWVQKAGTGIEKLDRKRRELQYVSTLRTSALQKAKGQEIRPGQLSVGRRRDFRRRPKERNPRRTGNPH